MNRDLLLASVVLAQCASFASAQGSQPYNALKFDVNGSSGRFYDAPGGSAGGGNVVAALDPAGSSAANGATPFSGSVEIEIGGALSIGRVDGNALGSLGGPWANAGEGGSLGTVSGFWNFQAGLSMGGEVSFTNSFGDQFVASLDPLNSGELKFSFGHYGMTALFDSVNLVDASGDGIFGAPATGVDISSFENTSPNGYFQIPWLSPSGNVLDFEAVIAVPAPAGAVVLGFGLVLSGRRRRN